MVDGDAPPERFDHERTLTDESVFRDTHPNVLRTNGFDLSQSRSQIAVPVGHRSARLPSPLAAWPMHHEPKRTRLQDSRRRFFDIHKFRSRPNLGLLHVKAVRSVHHLQSANPSCLDPTGERIDISPLGNADATRAGITTVDAQSTSGGVETRGQVKPQIIPPRFRTPQAVHTSGQRGCIARAPAAISTLAPGHTTGCWPAGQQTRAAMQFNLPDAVAVRKQLGRATGAELQWTALQQRRRWPLLPREISGRCSNAAAQQHRHQ